MKLARLLTDYLVQHKELTLEGLGHFTLDPSPAALPDQGQPASIGTIHFTENPKARTAPGLVDFISSQTGKMKALASSDLESFLEIGKQLLNIAKPFVMEGIGSLTRNAENKLEFTQDMFGTPGSESGERRKPRRSESSEIHFQDNYLKPSGRSGGSTRKLAVFSLLTVGLVLMAWVSWYFLQKNEMDMGFLQADRTRRVPNQQSQEVQSAAADQSQMQPNNDTVQIASPARDSSVAIQAVNIQPSQGFSIVLEVSRRNRAIKRYADLREWGHKVQMSTQDSLTFKLSIPIDAPLSDSLRHRDSLSRFFGKKVWIETN